MHKRRQLAEASSRISSHQQDHRLMVAKPLTGHTMIHPQMKMIPRMGLFAIAVADLGMFVANVTLPPTQVEPQL